MNIYTEEKQLETQILNSCLIKADCQLSSKQLTDTSKLFKSVAGYIDEDLYPVCTMLVSTGWNGNDDIFVGSELILAKQTPIHKPLNKHHKPREIVGHIVHSEIVDDDAQIIPSSVLEAVDTFNVLAEGVIYRHLKSLDEELEREMAEFIEELKNGEWFVSMETLFSDFDYGIKSPSFGERILQRNENTAFLTKHLRSYGGTGSYNGLQIGRVLRGLTFSAEGFVKNPANPKSLVLNNSSFAASAATLTDLNNETKVTIMSEITQAQYNAVLDENKELNEKLAAADISSYTKTIEDHEATIADLNKKVDEQSGELEKLQSSVAEKDGEIQQSIAKLEDLQKKLDESASQLKSVADEKARTDRIAIMVDAGIEKSEAETVVDKFADVNDEQFADIVELHKAKAVQAKEVTEAASTEEDDVEKDEDWEQAAEEVSVAEAEVEEDVALASEVDDSADVIADLSKYLTQKIK